MEQGSPHRRHDDAEILREGQPDEGVHEAPAQPAPRPPWQRSAPPAEPSSPPPAGDAAAPPAAAPAPPVDPPAAPPMPARAPSALPPLAEWLRTPRPEAKPGIWRCGHQPPPAEDPDRIPARQLISGAVVSFLIAWLIWSLLYNNYLGSAWLWPLDVLTPDSWAKGFEYVVASYLYYTLVITGLAVFFGKLGHWPEVARRAWGRIRRLGGSAAAATRPRTPPPPAPETDPVRWPQLRAGGAPEAADRLSAELCEGRMTDVDHARIDRAWQSVRARPQRLPAFTEAVLTRGAAACPHGSGARDLPLRAARHDLSLGQVRLGTADDSERNPHDYRGAGLALDPALLGTSALAVGPPGSGKTSRLVRPVVESLCLQALAGQAAVVAVTASGARLAPDESFDAVVRLGSPESAYDLDLYGGTADPDEAAGMLAEALVGDLTDALPGGDSRRAATALAQLIGPFRAVHGRFPDVPELRELLDGAPAALHALRAALEERRLGAQLRELDAYGRQSGRPGDAAALLADRIALLDRPAFAGFFTPESAAGTPESGEPETAGGQMPATGAESKSARRRFSLRALDRPVRVRVDLPERGHAEAARILARLVLAQFTECATAREDESLFAFLVLDDASQTVTPQSLRGLQRLQAAHSGVLLTLRALDDVPGQLRGPLLGAVGCRMVCAGIAPWDAERFTEVWGTEWVETRTVTNRQLVSDEPFTRLMHAVRRLATGRHVTAQSVTVRREQRERWSASELANELPAGHAVLSLTTVRGERTPPILTRLGD